MLKLAMLDDEKRKIKQWIDNWKEIDIVQDKLRREKIRKSVTAESISAFDSAFRSALWRSKKRSTSGFVEFHKILAKSI